MENISNWKEDIEAASTVGAKKRREKIGGMALFNGLLLRNKKRETIISVIHSKIAIDIRHIEVEEKFSIAKLPIIRGIVSITSTLRDSVPYVLESAKHAVSSLTKEEDIAVGKFELVCGYTIALFLILCFFMAIPNVLSLLVAEPLRNGIQAILQVLAFLAYIFTLKKSKFLQEVFEYHGAEHKVVNAYEDLEADEITVKNVKKESRFHKRCGGNFIIYLFLLVIVATLLIPSGDLILKTILQVLLIPAFIGISYELLMLLSKLPKPFSVLSYPAMAIQWVTTREPDDDKIKIAIYALRGCVNEDNTLSLKDYLDHYVKSNLEGISYEFSDILRLVAFVKKQDKDTLYASLEETNLTYQEQIILDTLLERVYQDHMPLQYILGKQSFYKEEYLVNEHVLIPRADSEILVEKAISYIEQEHLETMIDMCTGSGCIGISVAKHSSLKFTALVDLSTEALEVARKNIAKNEVVDRVCTMKSDLFEVFSKENAKKYDIIVSNPPYIPTDDIKTLDANVLKEPLMALDGGRDGMKLYRKILAQAKLVLREKGYLLLEIGYDEKEKITALIHSIGQYEILEQVKDYSGNDRVVVCRFLPI